MSFVTADKRKVLVGRFTCNYHALTENYAGRRHTPFIFWYWAGGGFLRL